MTMDGGAPQDQASNPFGVLGGGGDDSSSESSMPPLEDVYAGEEEAPDIPGAVPGSQLFRSNVVSEPDGNAFVARSAVDPRRRIVRARRPPAASSASGSGGGAGPGSRASGRADLSGAMGFLRQVNRSGTSGGGANAAGNNGGGGGPGGGLAARRWLQRDAARPGNGAPVAAEEDDYDEEEDDEDYHPDSDDEDEDDMHMLPPGGPAGFFRGFLNHMSEMSRRAARRRPVQTLSTKIRPDDDEEESDEDNDHENGARCAACFRNDNQSHKWRRLVTLPCCGKNGREDRASTRFCAACILKLAVTRHDSSNSGEYRLSDDEPDEYPVKKFYEKNPQREDRRFCECPRCRGILIVKIQGIEAALAGDSDDESSDGDCDCSDCVAERRVRRMGRGDAKTAKSISLCLPTFKGKCLHVGRKRGVAKLLWKASLLHHNFMPHEALAPTDDDKPLMMRLVGWGIVEKADVRANQLPIYRMPLENQIKLCKLLRLKDPSDADSKSESNMLMDISVGIGSTAWLRLRDEYRIDRSLRILNRFFFLVLHFNGQLPPLPLSWKQELAVTTLIIFSSCLVAQFLCVLVVYGAAFFGVGLSVCFALRRSNNFKSFWWQAILLSYIVYKGMAIFYQSPYLKWSVLVTPRAMTPVKKLWWEYVSVLRQLATGFGWVENSMIQHIGIFVLSGLIGYYALFQ